VDIADLGYLDGGSERDVRVILSLLISPADDRTYQIKALSKMQLPFWLTPVLLISCVSIPYELSK